MSATRSPPSADELAAFAAVVERGLLNLYHGDVTDRRVHYRVTEGSWPDGLTGRVFTTVFPAMRPRSRRPHPPRCAST